MYGEAAREHKNWRGAVLRGVLGATGRISTNTAMDIQCAQVEL